MDIVDLLKVGDEDRHVFIGTSCSRSMVLMMSRFTFDEYVDVFPGQVWLYPHVVYFLANVRIPCGLCMQYCVDNVPIHLLRLAHMVAWIAAVR